MMRHFEDIALQRFPFPRDERQLSSGFEVPRKKNLSSSSFDLDDNRSQVASLLLRRKRCEDA
jgi:hypothetical protein